jgi:hypothetical protein
LEKEQQRNLDKLVEDTENALQGELAGWVQQMQAALDRAQKQLEEATSKPAPKPAVKELPPVPPKPPEAAAGTAGITRSETNPASEPKAGK